jgi:hypothetical protein
MPIMDLFIMPGIIMDFFIMPGIIAFFIMPGIIMDLFIIPGIIAFFALLAIIISAIIIGAICLAVLFNCRDSCVSCRSRGFAFAMASHPSVVVNAFQRDAGLSTST